MGAPIGSRPAVGPANGGRPLPSTPKPAVTKQSPQKPLPRPTGQPVDEVKVNADFRMLNNRSFTSMVPDTVNTSTFTLTLKGSDGHVSQAHYVVLPDDTLKTSSEGLSFETAILEVVNERSIKDPSIAKSKKLAYILCQGERRVLICDATQLPKFENVSFFAFNFEGEGAICSLRGKEEDNYGIKLHGRNDGDINGKYQKAVEIYRKIHQ